jgi:hypothetical protein
MDLFLARTSCNVTSGFKSPVMTSRFAITKSKSIIITFLPNKDIPTPRLYVKVVLPTPPLPEAIAINFDIFTSYLFLIRNLSSSSK